MIISLTGFMGSGKTAVGSALADMLGCKFIDLDAEIARRAGRDIPTIFASGGEAEFRAMELETLRAVLKKKGGDEPSLVLSLGGGTVTVPEALRLVRDNTLCIWLRATEDTLRERLGLSFPAASSAPDSAQDYFSGRCRKNQFSTPSSLRHPTHAEADPSRPLLTEHAEADPSRPLLTEDWPELLASREPLYEAASAIAIDIDGLTPDEIAESLIIDCL